MSDVQTVPEEARENVTVEEGPTPEFEPLFSDEGGFSEEQLTGDGESQEIVDTTTEKKEVVEPPATEDEPTEEPEKAEAEKPEEAKPEETKEPAKPPEGYVEIQAMHAERKARQSLQRELEALKSEFFALKQKPAQEKEAKEDPWKDFKVLSDDEFKALQDDDPDEAISYLRKEQRFKEDQQKKELTQQLQDRAKYQEEQTLNRAWEQINEVIPNVFDRENKDVQETIKGLNEFAKKQGFSDDEIAVLTNPATRVIVKDREGNERMAMLADASATFLKVLKGFSQVEGSLTKDQESEIRKDEREKAIAEITAKIKKGETDFRSLGDAPTTSEKPVGSKDNFSEAEWSKLPPEERRKRLGG